MRVNDLCASCLLRGQRKKTDNAEYLARVEEMIANRTDDDSSPVLGYRFHELFKEYVGPLKSFAKEKKQYNDLALSIEGKISERISKAEYPLAKALMYSRVGNYIDFGAMVNVNEEEFLSLLEKAEIKEEELSVLSSMEEQLNKAKSFLLIADNAGEIVFDKLLVIELQKLFPHLKITVMVRGGEVSNDATMEDAKYVGLDKVANVISNGMPIAGTVYQMLSAEARQAIDSADVILSKGQGNYESLSGYGRHIFYSFLCKCDLFTSRFNVPKFTGMFIEDNKQ